MYHQAVESGAVVPALERTNSEGGAKKKRTKCEYSPVFTCEKMQKMPEADRLQFLRPKRCRNRGTRKTHEVNLLLL